MWPEGVKFLLQSCSTKLSSRWDPSLNMNSFVRTKKTPELNLLIVGEEFLFEFVDHRQVGVDEGFGKLSVIDQHLAYKLGNCLFRSFTDFNLAAIVLN